MRTVRITVSWPHAASPNSTLRARAQHPARAHSLGQITLRMRLRDTTSTETMCITATCESRSPLLSKYPEEKGSTVARIRAPFSVCQYQFYDLTMRLLSQNRLVGQ